MNWQSRLLLLIAGLAVIFISAYEHKPSPEVASRFIKLDTEGKPLGAWQGPWACILDNETGLVWENKTDDEGLHHFSWSYSWYLDDKGVPEFGDCYYGKVKCDTSYLIAQMNLEQTCGLSNWRLPSEKELSALISDNPKTGEAKIYGDYFPHTKRGDYWSSDAEVPLKGFYAYLKEGAMAISFKEGESREVVEKLLQEANAEIKPR